MIKFLLVGAIVLHVGLSQSNPYCQQTSGSTSSPPVPSLGKSFTTFMEANFVSKNYTVDTELHFEYEARRASVKMQYKNIELTLIYNYADDEIYAVERLANDTEASYACQAYTMTTASELNVFFGANKQNASYIIPNTIEQVLHFNNYPQTYNGSDIVRGIPVNKWTSCHSWPEMNAFFTVIYSFSQPNYKMPYVYQDDLNQIPVRAEVKGVVQQGGTLIPFETMYEFYHYDPKIRYSSRDMLTPPGVYCAGRKETKKPPKVASRYAYSEELVQVDEVQEGGTVSYLKRIHYDSIFKLVRYEIRNKVEDPLSFNVKNPLIIIHDYNIGVAYGINKLYGNCSVQPLSNSSFDSDSNFTQSLVEQGLGFAVQLKNPESFLHLDSVYIYTGQRIKNGIPVDVFISNRTDKYGSVYLQSTHEYEFLADGVLEASIDNVGKNLPVSLMVSINQLGKKFLYNYYNFEMDFSDLSVFDLRACFNADTSKRFAIEFPYRDQVDYDIFAVNFIQTLEQFMYYVLTKETKETGLRFAPVKISVSQNGRFYVQSAIYEAPSAINLYTKLSSSILVTASYTSLRNLTSADQCANACQSRVPCLSFDWCPLSKTCYLNARHVTDTSTSISSSQCDHYSRTTVDQVQLKTINQIYTLLDNTIALGLLKLSVPIVTQNGNINKEFVATEIREIKDPVDGDTDVVTHFNKIYPRTRYATAKDRFFSDYSIDDCARACEREPTFSCESFDYCFFNGECRLSRNESAPKEDLVQDSSCDIYQKDPLYHYYEYPFQTTINSNDIKFDVKSQYECARLCDNSRDIRCRSFNYCDQEKSCYLSSNHITENSNGLPTTLKCTHFSRSYIKDFTYRTTAEISLVDGDLIQANSNLELCSFECVNADGFTCKSFDFCPNSRACILNKKNSTKPANSDPLKPVDRCDNYLREYYYLTSTESGQSTPTPTKSQKDNSKLTLITLSITFSLVSLIGGVLAYLFVVPKLIKK